MREVPQLFFPLGALFRCVHNPVTHHRLSRRFLFASHVFPGPLRVLVASIESCFFPGVSNILINSSGQSYTFKCYAVSFRFPQPFYGFSMVSLLLYFSSSRSRVKPAVTVVQFQAGQRSRCPWALALCQNPLPTSGRSSD